MVGMEHHLSMLVCIPVMEMTVVTGDVVVVLGMGVAAVTTA